MGDAAVTVEAAGAPGGRSGVWPLAVRLARLQEARLAGGAVLLLPDGVIPDADFYCGWPVIRVPVPEPMIGLPGGHP